MSYVPLLSYRATGWTRGVHGGQVKISKRSKGLFGRERWKLMNTFNFAAVGCSPYRAVELQDAYGMAVEALRSHPAPPAHMLERMNELNGHATILFEAWATKSGTAEERDNLEYNASARAYSLINDYKKFASSVSRDAQTMPGNEIAHHHRAIASLKAKSEVDARRYSEIDSIYRERLHELS